MFSSMRTPTQVRTDNHDKANFLKSTFGLCPGYLQANMAIMPDDVAKDFEEFCRKNAAPCPLVYKSKKGEVGAPPLANQSDIRYL